MFSCINNAAVYAICINSLYKLFRYIYHPMRTEHIIDNIY